LSSSLLALLGDGYIRLTVKEHQHDTHATLKIMHPARSLPLSICSLRRKRDAMAEQNESDDDQPLVRLSFLLRAYSVCDDVHAQNHEQMYWQSPEVAG
jgi:hypothetical protein